MLICPIGCTDEDDRPLEMEFDFSREHAVNGKSAPGYRCPGCRTFETQNDRGRL